jgi:homoserine dehydrogenase
MARGNAVGVGIIGFGTIGTGVVRVLAQHAAQIRARLGRPVRVVRIADLDLTSDRGVRIPAGALTNDARALIADPHVDVVVELIGGTEPARTFHAEAIAAGKPVVSANKALLSQHGPDLAAAAARAGVSYGMEASVGGGIPILRTLREALVGDVNREVYGLVNGTANYILSEMADSGAGFDDVLARAQQMGLAEADPTYDVDGLDSMHKLVVLVALAFGKRIRPADVYVEGIRRIQGIDMAYAREFGYAIKLLAVARETTAGIEARVHPAMVPKSHLLASVGGAFNAVCVNGRALGSSVYYGQGAGMMPTATAVVADIVDAARALAGAAAAPPYGVAAEALAPTRVVPMKDITHEHYVRMELRDEPGVLGRITSILGAEKISIATVAQHEAARRGYVPVVMRTHQVREAAMSRALARIEKLKTCRSKPVVIRVEENLGGASS